MDVYFKEVDCQIGLGVFAGRRFHKGEAVLKPTGHVIDHQTIYSIQIGWDCHLDPDAPGKFLNHSCDPNVGVNTDRDGLPVFVAMREIEKDEHIVFDYAMTEYMHYPRPNPELEFELNCYCGAENCRGRLGYYTELSDELKQKYAGFISDYLVRRNGKSLDALRSAIDQTAFKEKR